MCLFGLKSGDKENQGRTLDDVVGEELCGVACCIEVWHCRVDVECHSTFDARNKTAKTYAFLCLNTIVSSQDPPLCVHYNIKVAILCPDNYSVFALHKHREKRVNTLSTLYSGSKYQLTN